MALRLPGRITPERASAATGLQPVEHEILSEMAVSLGRAGDKVALALKELAAHGSGDDEAWRARRVTLLRAAAAAVHAYFIQRELCGMRRHEDVIRDLNIPRAVLARLGAR